MGSRTKIFIVLEYITGGELFDKIVIHGRMGEDEARGYFHQLINAVDFCHSRGVYHRDFKPENLLLDTYGNLKISNFGLSVLSHQVKDDGLLHTSYGMPNYVAPEVLNDGGYDGATVDLWSCGVILFVLLFSYMSFDDSNLMRLYEKISNAEFSCPSWFSTGATKLLKRILRMVLVMVFSNMQLLEETGKLRDKIVVVGCCIMHHKQKETRLENIQEGVPKRPCTTSNCRCT